MAPAGGTQTVSARAATLLAWSLGAVTLALLCAGLALWALNGSPVLLGSNEATGGTVFRILAASTFALIAIVGLHIAKHQPTNPFGWLTLAAVLVSTLDLFSQNMGGNAHERWPAAARWIAAVAYPLNVSAGLVALMVLLFPNGRLPSSRWQFVLWPSVFVGLLQGVARVLRPGPLRV